MPSTLRALLCLGLCLSQRISAPKQTLPKPIIRAESTYMVPKEKQATLCCQGSYGAVEYQLHFEGSLFAVERPKPPERINGVKFHIPDMNSRKAGRYSCIYRVGELWSERSDLLDLVVTEMYDTPTLSVHPGPEVTSGEKVTFYCRLDTATSMFLLLKEGRSRDVQRSYGKVQAEFPMGPVTTAHRGSYRCFGSYNNYAWSFPSEPVKLLVTGDIENTSLAPTDPTFPNSWDTCLLTRETGLQKDLALWDTAQNLLRMGLAFLVLVALVCLLVEDWLSRKRTREQASRASTWEGRRRLNKHKDSEE